MRRPSVFTIPPGASFLDTLAAGLLTRSHGDPVALADAAVLLPTRRAGRALSAAFLRASGGRPIVLPRILPLGDLDEDQLAMEDDPPGALDLPPAISPLRRQLLLAQLILAMGRKTGHGPAAADQAARLAAELGRLLDQTQIERLSFDRLASLVPAEFAAHWQITLDFLRLVTREWPKILADEGRIEAADRRNALLDAQAAVWRARPPEALVIAAGSTGTVPATAALLRVIAFLPRGEVVLPGLDLDLDEASWAALEPTHPQWGMARLLRSLEIDRAEVRVWPACAPLSPRAAARQTLASEMMRPAATTEAWRHTELPVTEALDGITRIDCTGLDEEARVIALLMREAIECGGSAAMVTPDRGLARRVGAEMRRWDLTAEDTAGTPLAETPAGIFLRLTAGMVAEGWAPVPLLATLKHPLAAGGMRRGAFCELTRLLERRLLRGPRPDPDAAGLLQALRQRQEDDPEAEDDDIGRLNGFVQRIADMAAALAEAMRNPAADLVSLLTAHIRFAEGLAGTAEEDSEEGAGAIDGARWLWVGQEGEALARFVSELLEAAPGFTRIAGKDYAGLLGSLLEGVMVRPRSGAHPQLAILGTIEARLLKVDHLILGGLNEGVWPPQPTVDPWMSRPMRVAFGLPPPERRIGLSAHDFAQAFCAPRVTLTRATRAEGTPTQSSRWLLRLDSVLQAAGFDGEIGEPRKWLAWAGALDQPERPVTIAPPRPSPPLAARPRQLSVADVELWLRDPYAIYARHVLGLRPLAEIDADPGGAERGSFIHKALELFVHDSPNELPPDALERLVRFGEEVFGKAIERPNVIAFWWPRFKRTAAWVIGQERQLRPDTSAILTGQRGRLGFDAPAGRFTINGKVDRIDRRRDGSLGLTEYKTGSLPEVRDVNSGASPEMAVLAAMAIEGGFRAIPAGSVSRLVYWRLSGGRGGGEERRAAGKDTVPAAMAEAALAGLQAYIAAFDDPDMPYLAQPRPAFLPRYGDYDHLARIKEWVRSR